MGGWTGKILRVDLTTGRHCVETIPEDWRRDYIGGRGLAARYLFDEMDPTVDPLSPDNVLIFATGPLTGTPVPCGAPLYGCDQRGADQCHYDIQFRRPLGTRN